MATFKKFEEIESWKMARELTKQVYKVSNRGHFLETSLCGIKSGGPPSPLCLTLRRDTTGVELENSFSFWRPRKAPPQRLDVNCMLR